MSKSHLKIVPIAPDRKPTVGTLYDRVRRVVDEAAMENKVTFAEVIGVLDLIKMDMHKEINK